MDFSANNFSATYKVLVLGDSNVGKTCIVHRYCDERYYDTYISTIGKFSCCSHPCWNFSVFIFLLPSTLFYDFLVSREFVGQKTSLLKIERNAKNSFDVIQYTRISSSFMWNHKLSMKNLKTEAVDFRRNQIGITKSFPSLFGKLNWIFVQFLINNLYKFPIIFSYLHETKQPQTLSLFRISPQNNISITINDNLNLILTISNVKYCHHA